MPTANFQSLQGDPDFRGLPDSEKIKVLDHVDLDFRGLPQGEKIKVLGAIGGGQDEPAPTFLRPPQGQTYLRSTTWKDKASEVQNAVIPPAASVVGGAFGSPVVGGAVGYAGGKQVSRFLDENLLNNPLDQKEPTDTATQAGQVLQDFGTGVALGGLMKGVGVAAGVKPPVAPVLNEGRSLADRLAIGTYKSALKPSTANTLEQNDRMVLTALRDHILPYGEKSTAKLNVLNNEVNRAFNDVLMDKSATTSQLSTRPIKDAVNNMISFYESDPITKGYAEGMRKEFQHVLSMKEYLPVGQMAGLRARWNSQLTEYYKRAKTLAGQTQTESMSTETLKAVRDSASNTLYELAPELRQLGQRQAAIIDLESAVNRATNRINNWDLIGLSAVVAGVGADSLGFDKGGKSVAGAGGVILAFRIASNPNLKARIAFALAKEGQLATATPSTLELIGLTRQSAMMAQPVLKALPYPRTMGPGKEDASGIVKGGQEIVHAEPSDAYEKAWRQYADKTEGQFQTIPKQPRLQDRAPMPNEYGSPGPSPKMLADPGRFRNPVPDSSRGAVASRGNAIVDSVREGQMKPAAGAKELLRMAEEAKAQENTYAEELYRKMASSVTVPLAKGLLRR